MYIQKIWVFQDYETLQIWQAALKIHAASFTAKLPQVFLWRQGSGIYVEMVDFTVF